VDDAAALRTRLPTLPPGATVAVIGGGLTGIETAAEIGRQYPHLDVTLQTDGAVGPGLSQGGRLQVRRSLAKLGVAVVEWSSAGADAAAAADVVVWCGGFKVTSLATDSGLPVDEHGRLRVDATLRARGLDNVFGAGDAAVVDEPGYAFIRMSCAAALPMGRHAGDNILRAARHQVLKPFTTMYVGQCISLGRGNAVLQVVRADDTPRQMSFTGPLAGMAKEGICKLTVVGMRREAGPALQTGSRISLPFREGERAAV
jgi:NADH dehydrogenase FAD-containing subunit